MAHPTPSIENPRPDRGTLLRVFLLSFILFAYFMPQWADWNIDSRLALTHALVDRRSVNIDTTHWITWDKAVYNGHYYSDKAPGTAVLGAIPYAVFVGASHAPVLSGFLGWLESSGGWNQAIALGKSDTQSQPGASSIHLGGCQRSGPLNVQVIPWGNRLVPPPRQWALSKYLITVATVGLISALFVTFFFWFLGHFTRRQVTRWLATGLFAGATAALPYSSVFYSHQLVAAFLFTAFALLFLRSRRLVGRRAAPAVGFVLGLAFFTEYTVAIVVAVVGLYALWVLRHDLRETGWLALAGAVPVLGLMAYNYACFGSALDTGYTHDFCWSAAQGAGFAGFTSPKPGPLWDLTFGPYRGLFFTSPFLLLAAPGAWVMRRRGFGLEAIVCIVTAVTVIVAISAYWGWNGGRVDGPRYIVPIIPFLAFPVTFAIDAAARNVLAWALILAAAAWSFFATWTQLIAGSTFPTSWLRNPLFDYSLPQLSGNHIIPNFGLFLGLTGWSTLLPLAACLTLVALWPPSLLRVHRRAHDVASPRRAM